MIGQLTTLLRVKQLKEQQAFRVVNVKRAELAQADQAVAQAKTIMQESAATLDERCEAIYRELIGRDIEVGEVDVAKGKVLQIEKEHQKLVDAHERTIHVRTRVASELDAAVLAHRLATKAKDKYVIIRDEVSREFHDMMNMREEIEIEDMFGTRRQKIA